MVSGHAVEIRRCAARDLPGCARLFVDVFAEPPYREIWREAEALEYLSRLHELDPRNCYVAISGGAIVGVLLGYHYPWRGRTNYHVHELFVRADRRRTGVGRSLLTRAAAALGGDVYVELVAHRDAPAAAFYHHMGFGEPRTYRLYVGRVRALG